MADLQTAREKSRQLRSELPRRSSRVVDLLRAIREALKMPGPDILPDAEIENLEERLENLIGIIQDEYPDDEISIHAPPPAFSERIIELDSTLAILGRVIAESEAYKMFLNRLDRIDSVLPTKDYDFKEVKNLLRVEAIGNEILSALEESIRRFSTGDYKGSLDRAEEATQLLKKKFCGYCQKNFPNAPKGKASLHDLRRAVWEATKATGHNRLEWLVFPLLEISTFVRNMGSHPEEESAAPDWMIVRRKELIANPWTARLVLVCQLHAALELQELCVHCEERIAD